MEPRIRGHPSRNPAESTLVDLDRGHHQLPVAGALGEHFEVANDLIFRFLDLDQFAKLGRLAGLAFANDFRVRLEHTHDFFL